MSQFYSDMITWTALGLFGGALFLSAMPDAPAPERVADISTEQDAIPLADPIDIRELDMVAVPDALLAPVEIAEADLQTVTFTATGDQSPLTIQQAQVNTGVVTGESVNMRAGPGTSFAVVSRASRDDRLQVTGEQDGIWIEVMLPFGNDDLAWIHGNYFTPPTVTAGN